MTKRILSLIIVLAMLVSVLPVQMVGAEQTVATHGHSDAHKCSEHCPGGTITWTPWGVTNGSASTLPTASGHYYLECDLSLTARNDIPAGADVTICLNGWNITETGSGNVSYVSGYLTLADCTAYYDADGKYVSGAVTGCNASDGGCFNVRRGGKLVLESGKMVNNKASGGGGAVSLQSASGGSFSSFYMYGGEITGNNAASGGGLVANNGGKAYLYGGSITGNTDKNGGGDIYMVGADSRLTVSGAPKIGDGYFDNSSNPGLQVSGLTTGAKISYTTKTATAAANKVIAVAGTQQAWDAHWVVANGKSVSRDDSGFGFAHTHCPQLEEGCLHTDSWTPWQATADKPLPTASGSYYLTSDVNLTTRWNVSGSVDIRLCLNGFSIRQTTATQRAIKVYEGAKLTITDANGGCVIGGTSVGTGGGAIWVEDAVSADSVQGTSLQLYNITVSGGTTGYGGGVYILNNAQASLTNVTVTGCTSTQSGGGISVREGGKLTMTGCTVTGNTTGGDGGGLYAHKNTKITIGDTTFTGNTATGAGGGFGFGSSASGTVTGVTASGNTATNAGGVIIQGSSQVTVKDTTVEKNTAKLCGGIYLTGTAKLVAEGVTVKDNDATNKAAGLYWDTQDSKLTLKGDTIITGNKVSGEPRNLYMNNAAQMLTVTGLGDGAAIGISNRTGFVSEQVSADYSGKFTCDDGENVVTLQDDRLYIGSAHSHCIDGKTDCGHSQQSWTKWTSDNALPTASGSYYLDRDVNLTTRWNVSAGMDIQLCLNGHTIRQTTATQRVIKVYEGGKLTVTSCEKSGAIIGGSNVGTGGGAIWVEDAATKAGTSLQLYNATVTGGTTGYGGGIYILNHAEASLTNVTVTGCTSTQSGGGISVREGSKLTATGCTIENNQSKADGGGFYAHKDTVVQIRDTLVTGNASQTSGGGMGFGNTATGMLTNVTISANTAPNAAGLVVQGTSQVTATQMTFQNNEASGYGGAVYVNTGSALTLKDSAVTGNRAAKYGSVYTATGATLTLVSAQITGNEAQMGGGVYVSKDTAVTLEGKTVIRSNDGGNLYLTAGTTVELKALIQGASVAVSAGRGAFTGSCDDYTEYFTSDSPYQMVSYVDGSLHMVTAGEFYHKHCLCDGTVSQCDHENVEWDVWDKTDSLPASGYYYLLSDVTLTGEASISNDLHLCLNGHTVTAAQNKRILSTPKNTDVTISISDCQGSGKLTGGVDVAKETGGGAIFIRAGGQLELYGGTITGNTSITAAGAILLAADAKLTIYGGEISHNTAVAADGSWKDGGGIYAIAGSELTIYGGRISNNRGYSGGGVYFGGSGKLTIAGGSISQNMAYGQGGGVVARQGCQTLISGGQITSNSAIKDGGGVYLYGAQAQVTGGTITGNTSKASGGGMGLSKKAQVTITDVTITGNTSPNGGGMIVQGGAQLKLEGGSVSGNTSTGSGGGIYVSTDSSITMTGGTIAQNKASASGGGLYMAGGTVKMSGGQLLDNSAAKDGGGVYARSGPAEISGKTLISGNSAKGAGGAICFSGKAEGKILDGVFEKNKATNAGGMVVQGAANVEMAGGSFRYNTAENAGGGIYVNNSTLTVTGGTITGNTAVKGNAGGIYMYNSQVTVTGGSLTYNTSKKDGGGAYNNNGTLKLSGMYVAGNKTPGAGGGLGVTKKGKLILTGGTITGNEASNAGGIIVQGQAHLDMYGGTISGNKATSNGAGLYVNKSSASIYGGTFKENHAVKNGGGAYFWRSTIKAENASFCDNYSGTGGGGFVVYWSKFEGTKLLSSGNTCDSSGGGVLLTKISQIHFTDSIVENNTGTNAGGVLIQTWTTGTVSGLIIRNNQATNGWGGGLGQYTCTDIDYYDCEIYGNSATTKGGGVHMESARGSNTPLAYADFTNVKIYNNTAGTYGGGVSAFRQIIYSLNDCQIFDNKAGENGGGLANRDGAIGTFKNLEVIGNESGMTGSGIWISDNTDMHNVTVTGNKTAEGSAVYYAPSDFDGESYVLGLHKMSGNIRICDNEGTQEDLYIGEKTTIGVKAEGFGQDTKIHVQLESGILTNTILGAYDYEGGDLHYTVTYGDRSLKEPEYEQPTAGTEDQTEQDAAGSFDIWLYVGIGLITGAIVAAAAAVISKKKKAAKAQQK